jgi:hypothetical protein
MSTKIAFSTMALKGKINDGDPLWASFTGSFRNLALETIDVANEIYMGHPLTTWHKNNWRHSSNYMMGQHIGLDFDTEDQRSTLAHLAKDKFIAKYGSLIYTTPSHQPHAPRARVLFFLDRPIHQPKNYISAVASLLWLFGTADAKCKDPCRFFYGSVNCDVEWLDNVLPLDKLKEIIAQYQTTGTVVKRHHERNGDTPTDQQEVEDALRHIPPCGIDYNEWLAVLMGIHDEFGDAGMSLAESWAQGYPGEIERKWRSFTNSGNVSGKTTIATLFKLAKDRGWRKAA